MGHEGGFFCEPLVFLFGRGDEILSAFLLEPAEKSNH